MIYCGSRKASSASRHKASPGMRTTFRAPISFLRDGVDHKVSAVGKMKHLWVKSYFLFSDTVALLSNINISETGGDKSYCLLKRKQLLWELLENLDNSNKTAPPLSTGWACPSLWRAPIPTEAGGTARCLTDAGTGAGAG